MAFPPLFEGACRARGVEDAPPSVRAWREISWRDALGDGEVARRTCDALGLEWAAIAHAPCRWSSEPPTAVTVGWRLLRTCRFRAIRLREVVTPGINEDRVPRAGHRYGPTQGEQSDARDTRTLGRIPFVLAGHAGRSAPTANATPEHEPRPRFGSTPPASAEYCPRASWPCARR